MIEQRFRLDRTVTLGLLLAMAVQAGAGLMWAGRAAARMDQVEATVAVQAPVAERLARLEAQGAAHARQMDRIEAKLDRSGQ